MQEWNKEKTRKTKQLKGFDNPYPTLSNTELKKTIEYKVWKEKLNSFYSEKINDLKERLQDAYLKDRQMKLPDYPIFMAIAEDIGYDATGKSTGNGDGDLDLIKIELSKFINQIEANKL